MTIFSMMVQFWGPPGLGEADAILMKHRDALVEELGFSAATCMATTTTAGSFEAGADRGS